MPLRLISLAASLAALLGALLCLSGCKHPSYEIEDRDTPVQVVLEAPAAAQSDFSLSVLVYVGDKKAVDRVVNFPKGTTRVSPPLVYMRGGNQEVSVVIDGRAVASKKIGVKGPTWVVVRIRRDVVSIDGYNQDPSGR